MVSYFFLGFLLLRFVIGSSSPQTHFLEIRYPFGCAGAGVLDGFILDCIDSLVILPISGVGEFLVRDIDYHSRSIFITDPNRCFIRYFDSNEASWFPFHINYTTAFTFFDCASSFATSFDGAKIIDCLAGRNSTTVVIATSNLTHVGGEFSSCSRSHHIKRAPTYLFNTSDADFVLSWDPSNEACTQSRCLSPSNTAADGVSKRQTIIILFGVALLSLPSFTACWLACREHDRRRDRSAVGRRSRSVVRSIVAAYPTTEVGGNMVVPNSNETSCAICLGEYQAKERVTTIPYCKHFFHSDCIDEWLKRNVSCPVCRREPQI